MNLSITTDYATDTGSARPYLESIARAGFTHVHWCHEWNTDTRYGVKDIALIGTWLRELGLALLDLHASEGRAVSWMASDESKRAAGTALVANRMEMTAALGSDVIVLHVAPAVLDNTEAWLAPACRSLDALKAVHERHGVRIALENLGSNDNWTQLKLLFSKYSPPFLGLCYDSGHGNLNSPSLDNLELLRSRLIAVHLHDNDGSGDQHLVPFYGSVDWPRIADSIARSSYRKAVSLESSIKNHAGWDEERFLGEAFSAGKRLTALIDRCRAAARDR